MVVRVHSPCSRNLPCWVGDTLSRKSRGRRDLKDLNSNFHNGNEHLFEKNFSVEILTGYAKVRSGRVEGLPERAGSAQRAIPHRARRAAGLGGGFCFRHLGNEKVGCSVKGLTMRQQGLALRLGFKGLGLENPRLRRRPP